MSVQQIIVTVPEDMSLDDMAEMAERIMEVTAPSINKLSVGDTNNSEVAQLRDEVKKLSKLVADLSVPSRSHSRGLRNTSRDHSPYRRKRDTNKYSFWSCHFKFGANSKRCEDPCAWQPDLENGACSPSK